MDLKSRSNCAALFLLKMIASITEYPLVEFLHPPMVGERLLDIGPYLPEIDDYSNNH